MSTAVATRARAGLPTLAVAGALTVLLLVPILRGTPEVRLAVLVAAVAGVAGWVTAVHPVLTFRAFAGLLAFAPYADVPGTPVPLLLVLAAGIWVALLFLPGLDVRPGWPEAGLAVLGAVALVSVVATGATPDALVEYVAWLAATAVVVPVRHLPPAARAAVVRTFVHGCALAALLGIVLLRVDPQGLLLGNLWFVGYDATGTNAQFVLGTEANAIRLTGTFVEPNIAGLVLAAGLLLAVATTTGAHRVLLAGVIGGGLVLTLSRSALGTIVVAVLLVIAVSPPVRRARLLLASAAAGLGALAVPVVRERLLNSFGPNDTGSLARKLAFQDFDDSVSGHWWWGLGWDREEFRDPVVGRMVNFVANAPLLTVYRGGVVLGVVAVVLLLVIVVRSLAMARRSFETAVLGCGVAAFCLVALQLDFPVVIQHPAAAVFSFLLGLSLSSTSPGRRTEPEAGPA